ncbi:hypothetical protein [Achromobacter sp. 413638]|uniref:hypothetical protein n=1 Tax=Achromobacter sp. 413638 TaxID=3342385 RepID=UPI0032546ED9
MSDNQHFHGDVGQVAGRDIINTYSGTGSWWNESTPVLQRELRRYKDKLFDARCRHLFNWPIALMLGALFAGIGFLLYGNFASPNAGYLLMGWAVLILLIGLWLDHSRRSTGLEIGHYKWQIERIKLVLLDRI